MLREREREREREGERDWERTKPVIYRQQKRKKPPAYMHNSHLCTMLSVFIVIYVYLGLSKQELCILEISSAIRLFRHFMR